MTCDWEKGLAVAEACIGTPFHHQGRAPKTGLDCIGLVIVALRSAGMPVDDQTNYSRVPDGVRLRQAIVNHGAVEVLGIERGDLLLFRYNARPQHVALALSETRMIHSFAPAGQVVVCDIGAYWRRRLISIYRFPNLSE